MKASSPWSSELERRMKGVFLPPGQMNTGNELELNFIVLLLVRDCCCHRHFVVQLWQGDVCSVFELLRRLKLWLAFVEPKLISISERHHLPGLGTALTEASRMPSWECSGGSVGIPSSLTFQEGGRNHWGDETHLSALWS